MEHMSARADSKAMEMSVSLQTLKERRLVSSKGEVPLIKPRRKSWTTKNDSSKKGRRERQTEAIEAISVVMDSVNGKVASLVVGGWRLKLHSSSSSFHRGGLNLVQAIAWLVAHWTKGCERKSMGQTNEMIDGAIDASVMIQQNNCRARTCQTESNAFVPCSTQSAKGSLVCNANEMKTWNVSFRTFWSDDSRMQVQQFTFHFGSRFVSKDDNQGR
jgi:hypothetical protein